MTKFLQSPFHAYCSDHSKIGRVQVKNILQLGSLICCLHYNWEQHECHDWQQCFSFEMAGFLGFLVSHGNRLDWTHSSIHTWEHAELCLSDWRPFHHLQMLFQIVHCMSTVTDSQELQYLYRMHNQNSHTTQAGFTGYTAYKDWVYASTLQHTRLAFSGKLSPSLDVGCWNSLRRLNGTLVLLEVKTYENLLLNLHHYLC